MRFHDSDCDHSTTRQLVFFVTSHLFLADLNDGTALIFHRLPESGEVWDILIVIFAVADAK